MTAQPDFRRRLLLQRSLCGVGAVGSGLAASLSRATTAPAAAGLPRQALAFPRDHGSHPERRIEWWYLTGQVSTDPTSATEKGRELGFQVTFFRVRVPSTQSLRSRLAARHLIFAHTAVTDVMGQKLWHDQRIARSSGDAELDLASSSQTDTHVRLRDWSLQRRSSPAAGTVAYHVDLHGSDFSLALICSTCQPVLLQGDAGLSRKGPAATQASYYYSQPQLAVSGRIVLRGQDFLLRAAENRSASALPCSQTRNRAWLDHEWSDQLLHPDAVGWDWIGINLFDGSALTAFRLRDRLGGAVWDGGSWRAAPGTGKARIFERGEVAFEAQRHWRSPVSGARYPVEWRLRSPLGHYTVRALLDAQELDSRASTGAMYWEGLSELSDATGRPVGRGYLEMTGYASALRLG